MKADEFITHNLDEYKHCIQAGDLPANDQGPPRPGHAEDAGQDRDRAYPLRPKGGH